MSSLRPAIAIYFLIWWLTLFAVLPFGIRSQHEEETTPRNRSRCPGSAANASKLIWTTLVSAAIFAVMYVVYVYRLSRPRLNSRPAEALLTVSLPAYPAYLFYLNCGELRRQHDRYSAAYRKRRQRLGTKNMPNSRYFIVQKDDGWVIQAAGDDFGPYQITPGSHAVRRGCRASLVKRGKRGSLPAGENGHRFLGMDLWAGMPIRRGFSFQQRP